jgi:hypothetical protein
MLLALLVLLPACSQAAPQGELTPTHVIAGGGLELAQIRLAAVRFLEAYADSDEDVEPLEESVVGDDLEEWVRWLEVQNRGLSLTGSLEIRRLQVLEVTADQAMVAVDATVAFTVAGSGKVLRRFESPMLLARQGGVWSVFDATRDGRPMQDAISLLRPPASAEDGEVVVEVQSVFRFTTGTSVNIRLTNRSSRPVSVIDRTSLLQVGGLTVQGLASSVTLQDPVPPGGSAEGMIEFPQVPLDGLPEVVGVALRGADVDGVVVGLPAGAFEVAP